LLTSSDSEEKEKLLEDLMRIDFKGLRKLEDIKEYDEADKTWRGIDKLGLDYFKEIQKEQGISSDVDFRNLNNRSEKQIRLANEIVTRTLPYMERIIDNFLENGSVYSPLSKKAEIGDDGEEIIRVKGQMLKLKGDSINNKEETKSDLINHISQRLIENMHIYLPEAYAISTFITGMAKTEIIKYFNTYEPLVRVPPHLIGKARKEISESDSREESVGRIEKLVGSNTGSCNKFSPHLIHDSIQGNIMNLDEVDDYEAPFIVGESDFTRDNEIDIANAFDKIKSMSEEYPVGDEEFRERNQKIVSEYLTIDEEGNNPTYRNLGRKYGMTGHNVKRIIDRFLRMIRHPKNKMFINGIYDLLEE